MEIVDWVTTNWMVSLGAALSIVYVIVTVTPSKKDDTIFWRYYSKLKMILPGLPNLKKKDILMKAVGMTATKFAFKRVRRKK